MESNFEKKDIFIILLLAALTALAMFPLLFQGKILADSDTLALFYPFFDFYSKAIRNGESFLWNPLIFSGFPTYVSQSGGFLDPINRTIFSFTDGFTGVNIRLFLDYFLMMVFSYLAGRAYGISHLASSLIGMSYFLSVDFITNLSNPILANCVFLLPFLLFIFRHSLSGGYKRWLWCVLGGLGLGWAFLAGNAQIIVYSLCLFGIFAVSYFFVVYGGKKNLRTVLVWCVSVILLVAVGFVVGSPLIIPALKITPLSMRGGGIDPSYALARNIEPGDFILFLFPNYLYFPYLSVGRKALYIGAFMFFLALVAAIVIIRHWRFSTLKKENRSAFAFADSSMEINVRVKNAIPFAVGAFFALLLAIKWSPLSYILQRFPVFEMFRYIDRWMYVGTFFWAALGAWGFDLIRYVAGDVILKRIFMVLGLIVGGIAVFISSLNFLGKYFWGGVGSWLDFLFSFFLYGRFGFTKDPLHYREAIDRGINAWQKFVSFGEWTFLLPFMILIAAFFLIAMFLWQKISWKGFRVAGLVLSVATFFSIFSYYMVNHTTSLKSVELHGALLNRFIDSKEEMKLYRTYPVFLLRGWGGVVPPTYKISVEDAHASTQMKFSGGWPNIHSLSDIPSVEGYELLVSNDLYLTLAEIGSTFGGQQETKYLLDEDVINRLMSHLDVLSMMAGKYIISGLELPPNEDLNFLGKVPVSAYKIPLYIYENKVALPKFYFAKEAIEKPSRTLLALIQEGSREFSQNTYLDCDGCIGNAVKIAKNSDFKIVSYRNGFMKIKTKLDVPRWFVVSESYYPGWRAEIDGEEYKIVRANGIYMAVEVTEGEHEITLHYEGVLGEAPILRKIGFME